MTDTEHDDIATFRLPVRLQVALFVLMMVPIFTNALIAVHFGMFLSFAWSYLIEAAMVVLFWTLVPRLCTVRLCSDGVTIYSFWWLPWADVNVVAYRKLLGLPYFHVKRRRGFSWWIPLYYVGDRDLGSAIVGAAPPDHPFRLVSMPMPVQARRG
jgi:hypothetical protein